MIPTAIREAAADLGQQEAQRIEDELTTLVGMGMDLAVVRGPLTCEGGEIRSTLTFQCIPGGSVPSFACTVYRVSALGGFASA